MLLKVQYQHHKKYMKLTGSSYDSVIKDVKQKFDISTDHKVFLADETGTEVDDVFADIIEQKPDTLWMVIDTVAVTDWDCDMSSLSLLVYLLPPPSSGNKKFVKISVREALDRVVRFHKSCCSFEEVLGSTQTTQPYILAVGTSKSSIHDYYIAVDKWLIPCMAKSSLSAFDELFEIPTFGHKGRSRHMVAASLMAWLKFFISISSSAR
ncbi:hypothetical protein ROHU_035194 [Labeo rohita]|uniref:Uncharacterized protein n=1 Tax=Labeo rohita TaxID=84645 RepID=A0A498L5P8_LABRO|nr:hypothetical protein ROHU_035194 [Labeo rohita]